MTQRRAGLFILLTVFLDAAGIGIVAPVIPELIMRLTGEGLAAASRYGGLLLFSYAAMQFVCGPIMGNLSDRFGRRPVLLASLLAFGIDYAVMGFAPTLGWLFAGRTVAGIAGATFGTAAAYLADLVPPEERARSFGLIGAAFGLGFIAGPVAGGLLGGLGPRVPFFAAAVVSLLNALYGVFVLRESLPEHRRRAFSLRRANPLGALAQLRARPVVLGLAGSLFLYQIAHDTNPAVWSYYTMEKLHFSEREVGYSLGFVGLSITIVQGGLMRPLLARLGERRAVLVGFSLTALGFFGIALSENAPALYAAVVPFALGAIGAPALKALMSSQTPADAQGELQGALASLVGLVAVFAPPLQTTIFGHFAAQHASPYFPGAPFALAAVLLVASALWFARLAKKARLPARIERAPAQDAADAAPAAARKPH